MAVRSFNGSGDRIRLSGGSVGAVANSDFSLYALVRPSVVSGADRGILSLQVGTSELIVSLGTNGQNIGFISSDDYEVAYVNLVVNVWHHLVITKAGGTTSARAHGAVLGSGSWTRTDTGTTITDEASSVDRIEIGSFLDGNTFAGLIAVAALFPTQLTNGNVDSIDTTPSTQQLITLGAAGVWELNQASTATAVDDAVGTADQTAITGTTVDTDNDPTWTFLSTAFSAGGSIMRPGRHRGRYPARDSDWF
jgi:hypothetical protein